MLPMTLDYDEPSTVQDVSRHSEWISTKPAKFRKAARIKYVRYVTLSDFDLAIRKELQRIASLQQNWDFQGALPIDPEIIAAARKFVSELPSDLKSRISAPAVVPMRKGNFQFEWHDGPKTLELELETPQTIHYLKWHPEAGIEEEDVLPITDTHTATGLIQWFTGG